MTNNSVNSCGLFLSSSISRQVFTLNIYQSYLLEESLNTCNEYQIKIQEAIDENKHVDHIDALIKESDYYESLLNLAIASTNYDDQIQ
jgi:hypothetical protein